MKRTDSLISLIRTLSQSEKRYLSRQGGEGSDYMAVYEIIASGCDDPRTVRERFAAARPGASFDIAVGYLYEKLSDTLTDLRRRRNPDLGLLHSLDKIQMLYERSMFHECFELLGRTIERARLYEKNEILLMAIQLELEYYLRLDFPGITEQELYSRQYAQVEAIKNIRKVTEQASLFGLLRYRMLQRGTVRSEKQKKEMNDLMLSEMQIAASPGANNFEITKNHQLFQASYLIAVGDHRTALNSYRSLNKLFEANPHFWSDPPVYYLNALEGVLHSLRMAGNFEEMAYYTAKLRPLTEHPSAEFRVNTLCLLVQCELFPWLDTGDFARCAQIMEEHQKTLYNKESLLNPARRSELTLYTAIALIGNRRYERARKLLSSVVLDRGHDYRPLMRTLRLLRLLACYEIRDFDQIHYEMRTLKRGIGSRKEHTYRTEHILLDFLGTQPSSLLTEAARRRMWERFAPALDELHGDKFENQLLHIFDFTAWIESKILKRNLSEVVAEHFEKRMEKFRNI